jgi:hypothetical protein
MAINATTEVVHDGTRNVIVKLIGIGDGTDGNESFALKVDVSELAQPCRKVKIEKVQYDVSYGVVQLAWDAAPPVPICYLDGANELEFHGVDGLPPRTDETGSGDILLTTIGFEANSTYTIILHMVKKI